MQTQNKNAMTPRHFGQLQAYRLLTLLIPVFLSAVALGTVQEMRMEKRFGIGMSAAGPLSVLGLEADVNLTPDFAISGGFGTGLDYNTAMLKGRYFISGQWVSPYLALGFARWWTEGTQGSRLGPSVLVNRFLDPGTDYRRGFEVFIMHPGFGVQFTHPIGFSFFAEVQYLFKLVSLANGTYAGLGAHWYF